MREPTQAVGTGYKGALNRRRTLNTRLALTPIGLQVRRRKILPRAFYARHPVAVAPALLGTRLVHETPEGRIAARIVETEAYGQDDPAFRNWGIVDPGTGLIKPEGRGLALFGRPGTAYVYRVHTYWLLNIVTEPEGWAGCVLIRGVEPLEGRHLLWRRRPTARRERDLTSGPGRLTMAFGIDLRHHGADLTCPPLYVESGDDAPAFATSSRIGLKQGVARPWRYFIPGNPFVSPGTPSDQRRR